MQEWRWAVLNAVHLDPSTSHPDSLGLNIEQFTFFWSVLQKGITKLLDTVHAASAAAWPEGKRLESLVSRIDSALGLDAISVSKPLLWKLGGHPLLPRTLQLSMDYSRLLSLCTLTR
jgi:hypothetical protein